MEQTLDQFREYLDIRGNYNHTLALLQWDLDTLAPRKGLEPRLRAIGYFSTEAFRLSTSDEAGRMFQELSKPEQYDALDPAMQVSVRRSLRDYERLKRVPEDFYSDYVELQARSEKVWEQAKRSSDFSVFAPCLEKVISMTKQYVRYMEPDQDPYEVLLDEYEEGMDHATIDRVFAELKEGLLPLLEKIQACPRPDRTALSGHYDIASQKKVQELLLSYIGFDAEAGATGESEHPFTIELGIGDVRVTNHFREDDPLSAMFSAIHEGGHAIFGQNIDPKYAGTAAAEVNMMGLHESQSRFYENILGRSRGFWVPIYDQVQEILPQLKAVPLDTFWRAINDVHPSMIRTEADEVTYCLHIILRYEMDQAIFREEIPVRDLPQLWNDKMEELLGIRPATDAEGILQDMHWSDGSFGYFPSYLLGSMYDGMFLEALEQEKGSVETILEQGRISEITGWLNENIHQYGSLYTSKEVLQRVCGKELSAEPLLDYFEKKYTNLYNL